MPTARRLAGFRIGVGPPAVLVTPVRVRLRDRLEYRGISRVPKGTGDVIKLRPNEMAWLGPEAENRAMEEDGATTN